METLVVAYPTPVLVAILTVLFFLYRAWRVPLLQDDKKIQFSVSEPGTQVINHDASRTVCKESDFPENWWTGSDIFELEKRAIFSKVWLYLSHRSRFAKVGDYQSFDVAGFPIFLILGRDGQVRGFHNVCRHRAYSVTNKESGSSPVLGCRYHGWSYNTYGQLIKAPQFDNVPGFDKSQNSLFAVHTFTDPTGFIFVNLGASPTVVPADTAYVGSYVRANGLGSSRWIQRRTFEGKFNWKVGLCSKKFVDLMEPELEMIGTSLLPSLTKFMNNFRKSSESLSLFPMTSLHAVKGSQFWYTLSFLPITEQMTAVQCDLYSRKTDNVEHGLFSERLENLLRSAIQDLETDWKDGTSVLDVDMDDSDTQKNILRHVQAHAKLEKTEGTEVFPAMRKPRDNTKFQQAERLCKELDCLGSSDNHELDW